MELAAGQREGRRRGSGVGSYWLLIGRPATNSLNYRLRFLAARAPLRSRRAFPLRLLVLPIATITSSLSSSSVVTTAERRSFCALSFSALSPFVLARSLFRFVSRALFRFRPESPEKSSVDLITRNNPRGCEALPVRLPAPASQSASQLTNQPACACSLARPSAWAQVLHPFAH